MKFVISDPWDSSEKPWQKETKKVGLDLFKKLDTTFDASKLVSEYQAVVANYKTTAHTVDSAWKGAGLISATGKPSDITLTGGKYKETPAMSLTPYIKSIIDSFQCEKKRVRIMELLPGHTLNWHVDGVETDGCYITRFHIPIITNNNVLSQVSHQDFFLAPGEFGFLDTAFPHRVGNFGTETRTHLIIELVLNDYVKNLLDIDLHELKRRIARSTCATSLNNYK